MPVVGWVTGTTEEDPGAASRRTFSILMIFGAEPTIVFRVEETVGAAVADGDEGARVELVVGTDVVTGVEAGAVGDGDVASATATVVRTGETVLAAAGLIRVMAPPTTRTAMTPQDATRERARAAVTRCFISRHVRDRHGPVQDVPPFGPRHC